MGSATVAESPGEAIGAEHAGFVTRPGPEAARDRLAAASALHHALTAAPLPLDLPGVETARMHRTRTIGQLADFVLPRLAEPAAPLLVVVAGPTGAGKSTLVNTLAGGPVSEAGLLRPTTRSPVLVHHPADRPWFEGDRVLPGLRRVDRAESDQRSLQLVPSSTVRRGVALLDAPDFDSIDDENRAVSRALMAAADLVLFVMSTARYSDRAVWEHLDAVVEADTSVAVVLNRIPAGEHALVVPDFRQRVASRRVRSNATFLVDQVADQDPTALPASHVRGLRGWLDGLASDASARAEVSHRTATGALHSAAAVSAILAQAADQQAAAVRQILTAADRVYSAELRALKELVDHGRLVRSDTLGRWTDLLGLAGDPGRPSLTDALARLPERVSGREGSAGELDRLGVALDLTLESLVVDHAWRAAERASSELRATAHGGALLDWSTEDLTRPGRRLVSRARSSIRATRRQLEAIVVEELGSTVTATESDVRAAAVSLLIYAGSCTDDGETPSEQRLIAAARSAVAQALTALLAEDRDRYLQPVLDWAVTADGPERLRAAAAQASQVLASTDVASPR